MGVHLCGRCLQPRQNAESGLYASSFCISLGRSVSKRQKTGVWIAEFLQKRSDLKPNSPAQAVGRGTSSRQPSFFRILLECERNFCADLICHVLAADDPENETPRFQPRHFSSELQV